MAYTDPIVLIDNATANQTFVRQSSQKDGSDWIENDATIALTRRIVIRHSNAGASVVKGSKPIRRHLVQFTHEAWNATLGKTEKATLNVTLTNDPGTAITAAQIYDLRSFAREFLTAANIDKMLRDET
jgi:hypothetical protein